MDHPRRNCSYSDITYSYTDELEARSELSGLQAKKGQSTDNTCSLQDTIFIPLSSLRSVESARNSGKNEAVNGIEYYLFKIDYLFN